MSKKNERFSEKNLIVYFKKTCINKINTVTLRYDKTKNGIIMAHYIEVTIKYDKRLENGSVKRVSEVYMADAMSLTEAEAVVTDKMKPYIGGEFVATVAKRSRISEMWGMGADKYWLVRVSFVAIDERSGKEKRTVSQVLVGAESFGEAYRVFVEGMKDTVSDFELLSLSQSRIVEVFKVEG